MKLQYIVAEGTISAGFRFYGPFDTYQLADEYGKTSVFPFTIHTLIDPA